MSATRIYNPIIFNDEPDVGYGSSLQSAKIAIVSVPGSYFPNGVAFFKDYPTTDAMVTEQLLGLPSSKILVGQAHRSFEHIAALVDSTGAETNLEYLVGAPIKSSSFLYPEHCSFISYKPSGMIWAKESKTTIDLQKPVLSFWDSLNGSALIEPRGSTFDIYAREWPIEFFDIGSEKYIENNFNNGNRYRLPEKKYIYDVLSSYPTIGATVTSPLHICNHSKNCEPLCIDDDSDFYECYIRAKNNPFRDMNLICCAPIKKSDGTYLKLRASFQAETELEVFCYQRGESMAISKPTTGIIQKDHPKEFMSMPYRKISESDKKVYLFQT